MTPKAFEFTELFEDRRVLLSSFYWLIHFSDLQITLWKSGRQLLAAFSKEFYENPGNVSTNRKKGVKIQRRIVHALPVFKRVL